MIDGNINLYPVPIFCISHRFNRNTSTLQFIALTVSSPPPLSIDRNDGAFGAVIETIENMKLDFVVERETKRTFSADCSTTIIS